MRIDRIKLVAEMTRQDLTQKELAEKAGVSANIITRLKHDKYISMESIERLCNALDCSVDDILEFVND